MVKPPPARRRLTGRQQQGLEALIAGATVAEAAAAARVREDTVSKWLALPHFAQLLEDGRRERRAQVANRIDGALPEAVETLVAIMSDPHARDMDRIRAATALLDRGGIVKGVKVEVSGEVAATVEGPGAVTAALGALEAALGVLGESE